MNFIPRILSLSVAVAALPALRATAQSVSLTVTFGAQETGSCLGLASGVDLPTGDLIRFGYFTNPAPWIVDNFDNLPLLDSSFVELASARVGYFGGATVLDDAGTAVSHDDGVLYQQFPGLFAHDLTFNPEALGLVSTRCFIWAFDGGSINAASQHAIFSDDAWTLAGFGSAVYDIGTVDPLDANDVFLAVRGPEASSLGMGPLNKLQPIAAVPEPLSASLMLAGLAITLTRRRPARR